MPKLFEENNLFKFVYLLITKRILYFKKRWKLFGKVKNTNIDFLNIIR